MKNVYISFFLVLDAKYDCLNSLGTKWMPNVIDLRALRLPRLVLIVSNESQECFCAHHPTYRNSSVSLYSTVIYFDPYYSPLFWEIR